MASVDAYRLERGSRGPDQGDGGRRLLGRREFLRAAAGAALPLLLAPAQAMAAASAAERSPTWTEVAPPAPLGRIATWWAQAVRETPTPDGTWLETKRRDDVIPLHAAVEGEAPWPTNDVWYRTDEGYIHSGYVQPVRDEPQSVIRFVPSTGFWAEVSRPWTTARWSVTSAYAAAKFYYETVYRVVAAVQNDEGAWWYRLKEGYTPYRPGVYVPAADLRPIPRRDLLPLSPGVPDKRMVIDRSAQMITCYEGDQAVFVTPCATGHRGTPTPRGEFSVLYKRHTRRMNVQNIADPYDLPGVAFPIYITWSGVAIHGTYWHNDYGRVHSHGCVNVTADAARWLFRWVDPVCPYEAYTAEADRDSEGTRVTVV